MNDLFNHVYLSLLLKVIGRVNLGKDFTRDTIEITAFADPGSYLAFSAMPYDLYSRGLNDGLTENNVASQTQL